MEVSIKTEVGTIAAIPSAAAAAAAAPVEEPIIHSSPATPTPAAAEPEAEAEAEEEAGEAENNKATPTGLSFIDLVYDTILLEESTLHRSRSAPTRGFNNTGQPILVPLFYTRLARAFEIAQTVCYAFHEVHPRHRVSRLAGQELDEADLTTVENVKAYVRRIGGCNGYFLDDVQQEKEGESFVVDDDALDQSEDGHPAGEGSDQQKAQLQGQEQDQPHGQSASQQQQEQQDQEDEEDRFVLAKAGIVFPPGKLSDSDSYSIPALTEIQIKDFNDRYGLVNPEYQDMAARVLFRLRKDYWNRTITTQDLDRMEPELLNLYGSRHAQRRREAKAKKEAEKAKGCSDTALSQAEAQHLGEISHRLQGLRILEAGKGGLRGDVGKKDKRPTFGLQGLFDLPLILPTDGAYKSVSDGIMELYQRLVPSQNYMNRRTQLIQRLQGILNSGFPGQGLRLEVFGSYASGLGSESSDADLCITSEHFQKTASYNNVRAVARVLRGGGMTKVQAITNARVPIVKFVDPITKTNCDVNTNHVLGIHNSELIRCYTMIDDRVRPFLYSLKALVKKHGINDSSQAWLSSYAYVMMAIGFLQAQEPPIIPTLQIQPESQMTELYIQMNHEGRGGRDVINCTFDRDPKRYTNFGAANTKTVGQLLIEFFEFYSRFYDYQTMEVNVRCGKGIRVREDLTKIAARKNGNPNVKPPQRGRGEKKLVVMDPFIPDRNVAGSCVPRHLVRVWTIFESLYLTLSRGDFKGAFETIPGYDDQEYEYAGGRRTKLGGLTPAQLRMIASNQVRAQVKAADVQPRTPVQVQTQVKVQAQVAVQPQVQPPVVTAQAHGQGHGQRQAKAIDGSGTTETHRSREKKTERKLERKESRREKRELDRLEKNELSRVEKEQLNRREKRDLYKAATSSSNSIPSSATTATASATTTTVVSSTPITASPQQAAQELTVVNAGITAQKDVMTFSEGRATAITDGDDDDNDSQQGGSVDADGESRSRKRRQRRSVARGLHAATATTDAAATAAGPVTSSPVIQGGTTAEGAVAAAVFASAVARATNSANLKQSSTPATTLSPSHQAGGSDNNNNKNTSTRQQPAGEQYAQQLQQQHLRTQQLQQQQQQQKKLQKQQKQLNKQLSRQQAKQQRQQQQGQGQPGQGQQVQQLNPQFPVLAKTHQLLLGKSKEAGNNSGNRGRGGNGGTAAGHKNRDIVGSNGAAHSGSVNNGSGISTTAPASPAATVSGAKPNGSGSAKRLSRVQSNKPQPHSGPKAVANAAAFDH